MTADVFILGGHQTDGDIYQLDPNTLEDGGKAPWVGAFPFR